MTSCLHGFDSNRYLLLSYLVVWLLLNSQLPQQYPFLEYLNIEEYIHSINYLCTCFRVRYFMLYTYIGPRGTRVNIILITVITENIISYDSYRCRKDETKLREQRIARYLFELSIS